MGSKLCKLIARTAAHWRWIVRTFIAWVVLGVLATAPRCMAKRKLSKPNTRLSARTRA
jgi:hypothetical protein